MIETELEHARILYFEEGIIECFPRYGFNIQAKHAQSLKDCIQKLSNAPVGFMGHWGGEYSHSVDTEAVSIISTMPEIAVFTVINHDELSKEMSKISVMQTQFFDEDKKTFYFTDRDEAFAWLLENKAAYIRP